MLLPTQFMPSLPECMWAGEASSANLPMADQAGDGFRNTGEEGTRSEVTRGGSAIIQVLSLIKEKGR